MTFVLICVEGGIIDEVTYFDDAAKVVDALAVYVKGMNPEKQDAAVYNPHGMIANAKDFLDDQDTYVDRRAEILAQIASGEKPIYVIGNPSHPLGFMVVSPDDPLGYTDSAEALADLGQLRQDGRGHLLLYQVLPINHPIADKQALLEHAKDYGIDDLDPDTVKEYLY
jgi:hypothetical protein